MKNYTHTDADGHCAGAIVKLKYPDCEIFNINYHYKFPFNKIQKNEKVIITDFSLIPEDWDKLLAITKNVIWIDHHKSAIESAKGRPEEKLPGIRNTALAACVYTFYYFYEDEYVPRIVELVGDYDNWNFTFGDQANYARFGVELHETDPSTEQGLANWKDWMANDKNISWLMNDGKAVYDYRRNQAKKDFNAWGFFSKFEGHRVACLNTQMRSSQTFEFVDRAEYDIMAAFLFDGKQYTVSLYSPEDTDIDVSAICKKYGGGGHMHAAGMQCEELPFKKGK